jgi:hypothetical protein
LDLSTRILAIQARVGEAPALEGFPVLNYEGASMRPIDILAALVEQVEFLLERHLQQAQTEQLDHDYQLMMNDKVAADCNLLRLSLAKSEELTKSLRVEKDYY